MSAGTSAWLTPPRSVWNGQIVRTYLPEASSFFVYSSASFGCRDRRPLSDPHVLVGDRREGRGVLALGVDPPGGVEDLIDAVRVHREMERGDLVEVAVDPAHDAVGVVDRAGHEEARAGRAEPDLAVDPEGADARLVAVRGQDAVPRAVGLGLVGDEGGALDVHLLDFFF
jgi:hypothetical protein